MTKLVKLLKDEGLLENQINKIIRLYTKFVAKNNNLNSDEVDDDDEGVEVEQPKKTVAKSNKSKPVSKPQKSNFIAESRPSGKSNRTTPGNKANRKKMAVNAGPVQFGGVNKFETLTDGSELIVDSHKEDIKIDKKLTKKKPTTRGNRKIGSTILTCRECGDDSAVPANIAEGFDSVDSFICQSCILGNK